MLGSVSSQVGERRSQESRCGIESMMALHPIASPKIWRRSVGAIPFVGLDFHTQRQFFPLAMAMDIDSTVTEQAVLGCIRARRVNPRVFGLRVQRATDSPRFADSGSGGGLPKEVRWAQKMKLRLTSLCRQYPTSHISVCICAFRRPEYCCASIEGAEGSRPATLFTYCWLSWTTMPKTSARKHRIRL